MAERRSVLIIDDDRSWQAFLSVALRDKYNVIAAFDGSSGLKLAEEWLPDTILLDIEMPIKNGYEVCSELKANPKLSDIPIIFVSFKVNLEEKIAGFKLGADDYIVKPCEAELLSIKIDRSSGLYREKKALDEIASGAQVLAFEAMNNSADLGRALRFAERTYLWSSLDKLADDLFQTMAEFGLETSVMFITPAGPKFYAQNNYELSPLEKDMFVAIHQQERFVDFGCRTFCNFTLVSLLIKNMPLSAPERYGRIKDTVPWILGVMDSKVAALDFQNALVSNHQLINDAIHAISEHLTSALTRLNEKILADSLKSELASYLASASTILTQLSSSQGEFGLQIDKTLNPDTVNGQRVNETGSSDVDFF